MTVLGHRPADSSPPLFTSGNKAIRRLGNRINVSWAGMLSCPAAASNAATSEGPVTLQPCITKLSPSSHRDGLSPSGEPGSLPRNFGAMANLLRCGFAFPLFGGQEFSNRAPAAPAMLLPVCADQREVRRPGSRAAERFLSGPPTRSPWRRSAGYATHHCPHRIVAARVALLAQVPQQYSDGIRVPHAHSP